MTQHSGAATRPVHGLDGLAPEVIEAARLNRLPLDRPRRSTMDLLRLDGKVAVVTGGGGTGVGNAICHRLAEQGAKIAILDANAESGQKAATELAEMWGVETFSAGANVADWQQVKSAVDSVIAHFGAIDLLVNNAGGSGSIGLDGKAVGRGVPFAETTTEFINTTVAVNYIGLMYVTRAVLDPMMQHGSGRIINIASEGGKIGMPGSAVYSSSKSAVIGFTRCLAQEIGPKGLSTVAVCPGVLITDRLLEPGAITTRMMEGMFGASLGRSTIGRAAIVDEVASVVAFLASDAGAYIHATAVSVGGGMSD
jgi:3-oxoacyl-[acyl-carrier protein] reductase